MYYVHYTWLCKPVIIQNRWYNKVYSCDNYLNFIVDFFNINPPYYHKILYNLIVNHLNGEYKEFEMILTKDMSLELNKKYLDKYLENERIMSEMHMDILYSCIDSTIVR